jgi:hypothetical protein
MSIEIELKEWRHPASVGSRDELIFQFQISYEVKPKSAPSLKGVQLSISLSSHPKDVRRVRDVQFGDRTDLKTSFKNGNLLRGVIEWTEQLYSGHNHQIFSDIQFTGPELGDGWSFDGPMVTFSSNTLSPDDEPPLPKPPVPTSRG